MNIELFENVAIDGSMSLEMERREAIERLKGISVDELADKFDWVDIYPEFIWKVGESLGLRHGAGFESILNRLVHLLGEGSEDV